MDKEDPSIRIGAIMGLGITYAGTQSEPVKYLKFWQNLNLGGCSNFVLHNKHVLPPLL